MPNRLASEMSPYLLQHAHNPVDWHPWGDDAFELARHADKPIFLSIGYATCHWCHVMERESFEDPTVAALMNDAFINVKVDREERPDVDQVYMTVCQLLTGGGGWPLTIIMTPESSPFFAATYIPRENRFGRIGMVELVPRIQELWQSDRATLLESAERLVTTLATTVERDRGAAVSPELARTAFAELSQRFDEAHGGFGTRPKFPSPHTLVFLLQHWRLAGDVSARGIAESTLQSMRRGGIYDHVGFGFHRYSTDREWLVPHFEKMLYDQAMMILAYTEALAATGNAEYGRVAREIVDYVLRDLKDSEGGFHSAEDADSEGEEGRFYVWSLAEIRSVLDESEASFAETLWNVEEGGNFLDEATQRRTGANILHLKESQSQAAVRLGLERGAFEQRLESTRLALLAARGERVRPLKDDKVLADWNGLMAAALARLGRVMADPRAVDAGRTAVDFVLSRMRSDDGRLLHRYRARSASIPGFLDDYAFMTWACLELYDATLDPTHLGRALDLHGQAMELFWDDSGGGFFFTAEDSEPLLVRQKEVYDGAIPSGNSVAIANLVRLGNLTGDAALLNLAGRTVRTFGRDLLAAPSAHCHLMTALQAAASRPLQIVIAGDAAATATRRLIAAARAAYLPGVTLLLIPDGPAGGHVRELAPFTAAHTAIDGAPTAYVCRDFSCRLPTTDPSELAAMLEAESSSSGLQDGSGPEFES